MEIREARPEENDELISLQEVCPQSGNLVVSVVNVPDFFARAKAYEDFKVFVVLEDERIIGSGTIGIRKAIINGEVCRAAYGFQAFVAPEYRRKGALRLMQTNAERHAIRKGAHIYYALFIENNMPVIRYHEQKGFKFHRKLIVTALPVYREMKVPFEADITHAKPEDLPSIAKILNETWREHELYEPATAETLKQFINRTPGYELNNLLVLKDYGKVVACLGYWNWHKVMRITVQALSTKLRLIGLLAKAAGLFVPMPTPVKPGDILKQIVLTPIGYKDPRYFSALLRFLNNQALQMGIEQIFCICEKNHEILKNMKGFIRIGTTHNLHIKPLKGNDMAPDKPVFIDGIDL